MTVEPLPGDQLTQLFREVRIQATPDGSGTITPLIGTDQATSAPAWTTAVTALDRRIDITERD